jgi:hypothetical protein
MHQTLGEIDAAGIRLAMKFRSPERNRTDPSKPDARGFPLDKRSRGIAEHGGKPSHFSSFL